jgi:tetratricopeptide (TPR) repeat protein
VTKPVYLYVKSLSTRETPIQTDAFFIPFDDTDKLKILFLPFLSLKEDGDLSSHVFNQLNEVNEVERLGFSIRLLQDSSNAYSFEKMNTLGRKHGANIVLSGYELGNGQLLRYTIIGDYRVLPGFQPDDTLSRQEYNTASDLHSGFLPTDLKNLIRALQALSDISHDRFTEALKNYQRIEIPIDDSLKYEDILLKHGICLAELEKRTEAKIFYEAVLRLNPRNPDALNNLGVYYLNFQDSTYARVLLKRAIAVNPNFAYAYSNLSATFGKSQEDIDSAIQLLHRSMELGSTASNTFAKLGLRYGMLKMDDISLIYYMMAWKAEPKPRYANQIGNIWSKRNQYDSALHYYKRALMLEQTLFEATANLARVLAATEKHDTAIIFFNKAIDLSCGDDDFLHYNLAISYSKIGKVDEAIATYQRALEINPSNSSALANLGSIFLLEKCDTTAAINKFKQSIEANSDYVIGYARLIALYAAMGEIKSARKYLRTAISHCPETKELWDRLDKEFISGLSKSY